MNRRQLLAALAAAPLLSGLASAAAPTPGGDIAILRQALALHPGTYRYNCEHR